jgi:hypothetical protein
MSDKPYQLNTQTHNSRESKGKALPLKRIAKTSPLILLAVLTSFFMATGHGSVTPKLNSNSPSMETWISCTPVEVATYGNRVHVECSSSTGGVRFFAASTSDWQNAARVLSVISTAQVAGRTLNILYDPSDLSGEFIGCQTNDCRLIRAVAFGR